MILCKLFTTILIYLNIANQHRSNVILLFKCIQKRMKILLKFSRKFFVNHTIQIFKVLNISKQFKVFMKKSEESFMNVLYY